MISKRVGSGILLVAVLLVTALAAAPSAFAAASAEPYQGGNPPDSLGFNSILPPGTHGVADAGEAARFEADGTRPPHWGGDGGANDQHRMYGDLVYDTPGLTASKIKDFYKDNSFGVAPGKMESTEAPPLRCTPTPVDCHVVIVRDSEFGVPHIYGDTRADVMYGAGYANASDRLFFMDVLRHAGRATLSSFIGGLQKGMDVSQWQFAPYKEDNPNTPTVNEDEYQLQYDSADEVYGAEGVQLQQDVQNYVAGINGYIAEARVNPNKMPAEYGALQLPLNDWLITDPIATASLIGGTFGRGGGNEIGNALVKQAAIRRFGSAAGTKAFTDFRRAEDPEAPTTVKDTQFPYQAQGPINPAAIAMPQAGSLRDPQGSQGESASASSSSQSSSSNDSGVKVDLSPLTELNGSASNALLVSGQHTESGHPMAVFGPQVGYWSPEILMEQELHCIGTCQGGLDIDSSGATFPGVGLYTLLGRGPDFAWSATSAGQDIIDTFAEELCEPDGTTPTINSQWYRWRGNCKKMEELTRTNNVVPNAADQCGTEQDPTPCGPYTIRSERTVHGIVYKRGKVKGKFVAFARQRSSYHHEADSARAFISLNSTSGPPCATSQPNEVCSVSSAEDFKRAMYKMNLTFNWFYTDDQDIAYFNSGDNPVRGDGTSMTVPNWGTGDFDWKHFRPVRRNADGSLALNCGTGTQPCDGRSDVTPIEEHPQVVNQSYISSWNNKQARGYRAADDNYAYSSHHRSQSLDDRVEQRINSGSPLRLEGLIDAVEDAGTVDLRGSKVLPLLLDVVAAPSGGTVAPAEQPCPAGMSLADAAATLRDWVNSGAHRRDRNNNDTYEDACAVQLMDSWWPKLLNAEFRPALGDELFNEVQNMIGFDDAPGPVGSAYISGWYGYVSKDLRRLLGQRVRQPLSRNYCGGTETTNGTLAACRTALTGALNDAIANPPAYGSPGCLTGKSAQWCHDAVNFSAVGLITVPPIHWINRPTFQQAVEVQGHRPR